MATRREKVILELQDDFTSGMARAAAATALLDKNLDSLSGSAVKSRRSVSDMNQPDGLPALNRNSAATSNSINQLTGRLRLMVDAATVLGPALVPLGAAAVPALSGMATQLTLTAAAAGTAFLAFKGVGDGLKTLNDYQLDPTAANLEKVREAMSNLGPAGADFVHFLDDIAPKLQGLQMTAREGMFPGVEDGITSLLDLLPQVDRIVGNVAEAMGQLASEAGAGLSGDGFTAFFDYLEHTARPILLDMGHTIGNFAEGLANMLVGFGPLSENFSGGLLEMSRSFSEWSQSLETNDSFQGFIDYVREAGPKALDLLGSLVDAFVNIARAAAPVGDAVLPVLTKIVDAVAALAGSDMGSLFITAAAGLSVYSRAAGVAQSITAKLALSGTGLAQLNTAAARLGTGMRVGAAGAGMLALSMTDIDNKAGLANTAMGAMAGLMVGGPWGAAIGGGIGLVMDFAAANDDAVEAIDRLRDSLHSTPDQIELRTDEVRGQLDQLRQDRDSFWSIGPSEGQSVWEKIGSDINALAGNEANLRDALGQGQAAMRENTGMADLLGVAIGQTGRQMRHAANDAAALTGQLAALQGFLDKRSAIRNYEESIDELGKALRKNSHGWDVDTKKGREHQEMLDNTALSIAQVAEQIKSPKARNTFISGAIKDLGGLQKLSPAARHAIQQVINQLKDLDHTKAKPKVDADNKPAHDKINDANDWLDKYGRKKPNPKLDADNKPAKGKVDETNHWLDFINGRRASATIDVTSNAATIAAQTAAILNNLPDEIVYIHTVRTGPGGQGAGFDGAADGATVPKTGLGYADRHPYLLADGEEIVSNRYGQADAWRPLLKAISANRMADGGTTGKFSKPYATITSTSTSRTVERVVERMPGTVVLNAPGLGRIVATVADQRIAADHTYRGRLDDRD